MIIPLKQAVVLVVFFFSLLLSLKAQDVPYSQYYSNLVYLNPAFAGTRTESRVNMFYRNQWPRSNAGFQSFGIAYDMPIQNSNSGFGVMLTNDMAGGFVEPSF
jgi:type IX secretion system PorP/SprF family membrane protein